uniref:Uncharacterized protein n=1 Tax=Vitrella brassicaformis TaxID=1169539 RepID=A0A7S1KHT6_9ALVE
MDDIRPHSCLRIDRRQPSVACFQVRQQSLSLSAGLRGEVAVAFAVWKQPPMLGGWMDGWMDEVVGGRQEPSGLCWWSQSGVYSLLYFLPPSVHEMDEDSFVWMIGWWISVCELWMESICLLDVGWMDGCALSLFSVLEEVIV